MSFLGWRCTTGSDGFDLGIRLLLVFCFAPLCQLRLALPPAPGPAASVSTLNTALFWPEAPAANPSFRGFPGDNFSDLPRVAVIGSIGGGLFHRPFRKGAECLAAIKPPNATAMASCSRSSSNDNRCQTPTVAIKGPRLVTPPACGTHLSLKSGRSSLSMCGLNLKEWW